MKKSVSSSPENTVTKLNDRTGTPACLTGLLSMLDQNIKQIEEIKSLIQNTLQSFGEKELQNLVALLSSPQGTAQGTPPRSLFTDLTGFTNLILSVVSQAIRQSEKNF